MTGAVSEALAEVSCGDASPAGAVDRQRGGRPFPIIGIVCAGGIGLCLSETIRVFEWEQVSFLSITGLINVAAILLAEIARCHHWWT
jgi:hypothetical protein